MAKRNHQALIVDDGAILDTEATEETVVLGVCPHCGVVETEGRLDSTGVTETCSECGEETTEYRGHRYVTTPADRASFPPEGGIRLYEPE